MRRPKKEVQPLKGKRAAATREGAGDASGEKGELASGDTPDGFFPPGVFKKMKIVVQNRRTNAFLTPDAKWIRHVHGARQFTTSLEALRFCAEHELRETDMVVCYPGARTNVRLPLI